MKFLFVVITCNRFYYAKSCIDSVLQFADLSDNTQLMILDNCTVEEGWSEYLKSISTKTIIHKFDKRHPGELYISMNYAIDYCINNNIDVINFIQDDYQYLYKIKNKTDRIEYIFNKYEDIVQIRTNLVWQSKLYTISKNPIIDVDGINFSVCPSLPADNGFTKISTYKKTGLYPENAALHWNPDSRCRNKEKWIFGERWFSARCGELNVKQAISLCPNIGQMHKAARIRGSQRLGEYRKPDGYMICPFSQKQIDLVYRNNQNKKWSTNDMCIDAWGDKCFTRKGDDSIVFDLPLGARILLGEQQ